jgi:hypothetical protein
LADRATLIRLGAKNHSPRPGTPEPYDLGIGGIGKSLRKIKKYHYISDLNNRRTWQNAFKVSVEKPNHLAVLIGIRSSPCLMHRIA